MIQIDLPPREARVHRLEEIRVTELADESPASPVEWDLRAVHRRADYEAGYRQAITRVLALLDDKTAPEELRRELSTPEFPFFEDGLGI